MYNKVDLVDHPIEVREPDQAIGQDGLSAREPHPGGGRILPRELLAARVFLSFEKLGQASFLRNNARIVAEEFVAEGVIIKAEVDAKIASMLRAFQN